MINPRENLLRINHIYYISSVVKCGVIFTTLPISVIINPHTLTRCVIL